MQDQLKKVLKDKGIKEEEFDMYEPKSEKTSKSGEKFYAGTEIAQPSKMERDNFDPDAKLKDAAWLRVAKVLGVKDAELVKARINEHNALLQNLRSHDALANMIRKIGVCAGLYTESDLKQPYSTREALAAGVALQNIFSVLVSDAISTSKDSNQLSAKIEQLESQLKSLLTKNNNLKEETTELENQLRSVGRNKRIRLPDSEEIFIILKIPNKPIKYLWQGPKKFQLARYKKSTFETVLDARKVIDDIAKGNGDHEIPSKAAKYLRILKTSFEEMGS